nr:reverse transcriptase domain-containing protein [Tanacetum cinerariifolium]
MLVQQGEGSGTPTEPYHTPSFEAQSPSHTTHTSPTLPPVTTTSISTVTPSNIPIVRQYTRRTRIAQSYVPPTVGDELDSPLRDVSQGEACPSDSGFIADQDRATIAKSSTLPHDSAPRVTSSAAVEGKINKLKERVKLLEDKEGVAATRSRDDAPIKGRSMDEGEAATERISDDSKEMETVLTSMNAATVLASGVVDVPTGNGSIPTATTPAEEQVPTGSEVVPTASPVFATATVVTHYRRRKGKEVMVESETPKKQKVQKQIDAQVARELEEQLEREDQRKSEQIARDTKIARIRAEEELQIMIDGLDRNNETIAKYLQEYHQFASELPMERRIELITDLVKGMTFEEVEAKFNSVWKQMEDFIPMGSNEEAERIKRKGLNLEQESAKKQKTSEEVPEEVKSPEEKVKEIMQLVPIEEVYVEALQVKHPIIDWKVYHEGQRSYLNITRLGGSLASYQFFIDLLKHLDREDLNQLWRLVKETLSNRPPSSYWRLYDTCGVHHVTAKDKEIFMLVEKDYPLRKALALVMICYKLHVKNYSQMANDLVLKIYKIANSPRQQGFNIEIKDKKGAKNMVAYHLSRLENPHMEVLTEREIADEFPDEYLMMLKAKLNDVEPWYADYINYIIRKVVPPKWTFKRRKRCVAGSEIFEILEHCHSGPTRGHYSTSVARRKVYEFGFFCPNIFKDAKDYVMKCDASQRSRNISSRSEMPRNNIQLERALQKYGVTHKLSTAYHPQSNVKTKVTNRDIKRILEKSVGYNPNDWSEKLTMHYGHLGLLTRHRRDIPPLD